MDAQWKIELEALQRLLANQQQQIEILQKQLGAPADDAEEAELFVVENDKAGDLPASPRPDPAHVRTAADATADTHTATHGPRAHTL